MTREEALAALDKAEKRPKRCRRQQALDILNGVKPKPRAAVTHPEWELQCKCVAWFKEHYGGVLIGSSLNGVPLTDPQARRELQAGLLKGMPDLQIFAARRGYHGLFIEMKNGKKGVVRDTQLDCMDKLKKEHYCCAVCRTFEQFVHIVTWYFG